MRVWVEGEKLATKKKNPSREAAQGVKESKSARAAATKAPVRKPAGKAAAEPAEPGRRPGRLPTGSLHAQPRAPEGAEELKRKLTQVMNVSQKLKKLRSSVPKNFYAIGEILQQVREDELHEAKGYRTVEDFAEREAGLSPQHSTAALRIFETFLPAAAERISFQKLSAAIRAIDETADANKAGPQTPLTRARSPIPPHKL